MDRNRRRRSRLDRDRTRGVISLDLLARVARASFWAECRKYYDEHFKRQQEFGRDYEIADFTWAMIRAKWNSRAKTYLPPLGAWAELFNVECSGHCDQKSEDKLVFLEEDDPALRPATANGPRSVPSARTNRQNLTIRPNH